MAIETFPTADVGGSVNINVDLAEEQEDQWERLRRHVGKLDGKPDEAVTDEDVLLFLLELEEHVLHVTDDDFGTR